MENTVYQKLDALEKLQQIDSKLDELYRVRGALPEEVRDLEDELAGYEARILKFDEQIVELNQQVLSRKSIIKESEKLIQKYGEQQMSVRNNREYDAITKELELQHLEIGLSKKKIKESSENIERIKVEIEKTKAIKDERVKDLEAKKFELESIISESESEEKKLHNQRVKAEKQTEERLLRSYTNIRGTVRNGLALVSVKRQACGGCFNLVPPQRQADIRERKKVIVCEHCGRIFSRVEDIIEEKPPTKPVRKRAAK